MYVITSFIKSDLRGSRAAGRASWPFIDYERSRTCPRRICAAMLGEVTYRRGDKEEDKMLESWLLSVTWDFYISLLFFVSISLLSKNNHFKITDRNIKAFHCCVVCGCDVTCVDVTLGRRMSGRCKVDEGGNSEDTLSFSLYIFLFLFCLCHLDNKIFKERYHRGGKE